MMRFPVGPSSAGMMHSIQRLEEAARIQSGVSSGRLALIDETNFVDNVGEYALSKIAERFYGKVLRDKDAWFSGMFKSDFDVMCQNQCDFLIQRFGGPSFYSDRRGIMKLLWFHSNFEISQRTTDRWLKHMKESINDLVEDEILDADYRDVLYDYFNFTAHYLLAASQERQQAETTNTIDEGAAILYSADPNIDRNLAALDSDVAAILASGGSPSRRTTRKGKFSAKNNSKAADGDTTTGSVGKKMSISRARSEEKGGKLSRSNSVIRGTKKGK